MRRPWKSLGKKPWIRGRGDTYLNNTNHGWPRQSPNIKALIFFFLPFFHFPNPPLRQCSSQVFRSWIVDGSTLGPSPS